MAPQAPLVDVSKATPPAESGAGEDEMSPTTGARLKMRSRGRARMLRQAVELIDPVTMERIDAERDALLKKALLSQGVELQQLLPRLKEDFSDAHATPEIVQARFKGFERMRTELEAATFSAAATPVVANVNAEDHPADAAAIRDLLVAQVSSTVRWRESMANLFGRGVTRCFEFGPGGVLKGLVRQNDRSRTCLSVITVEGVQAAAKELSACAS